MSFKKGLSCMSAALKYTWNTDVYVPFLKNTLLSCRLNHVCFSPNKTNTAGALHLLDLLLYGRFFLRHPQGTSVAHPSYYKRNREYGALICYQTGNRKRIGIERKDVSTEFIMVSFR